GSVKRLSAISLLVCVACVTTKEEGEKMRARIDALEKDLKAERESRQAEQTAKLKQVQDAMDALNRAARKSGADLAVDLEKAQNELAQIRGMLEVSQHRLDQVDQGNAERDRRIDESARFVATRQ